MTIHTTTNITCRHRPAVKRMIITRTQTNVSHIQTCYFGGIFSKSQIPLLHHITDANSRVFTSLSSLSATIHASLCFAYLLVPLPGDSSRLCPLVVMINHISLHDVRFVSPVLVRSGCCSHRPNIRKPVESDTMGRFV